MPQYRVLRKAFIGGRIRQEGEIIDAPIGKPGGNLELVKTDKPKAKPGGDDDLA